MTLDCCASKPTPLLVCVQDCRQRFRAVLVEATVKLDEQVKRIGRAVDDSKPYWEARKVARQVRAHTHTHSLTHTHTHDHRGELE